MNFTRRGQQLAVVHAAQETSYTHLTSVYEAALARVVPTIDCL